MTAVPELPEVELARTVLDGALDRGSRSVDDNDGWVCRPHPPGEIAAALVGGRLIAAHRQGKAMWCETSAGDGGPGPNLGIHLGMGGRIIVADGRVGPTRARAHRDPGPPKPEWNRFTVTFDDGGTLRLFDKRRLGRVRLDPDLEALGPDAETIGREEFRVRVGRGRSAVKARLLDQSVLAGVGNLLADETLWQAALSPVRTAPTNWARSPSTISTTAGDRTQGRHRARRCAHRRDRRAPQPGGPARAAVRRGAAGTVGGRSTWWCRSEQV